LTCLKILIPQVLKIFIKNLFITKSSEFRSFFVNGQTSKQYIANYFGVNTVLLGVCYVLRLGRGAE